MILSASLAFHLSVILLPGLHGSSVLTGYKIAFLQCAKLRRECSANSNYDFQGLVIHTYKKQWRSFVTGSSKYSINQAPQKQLYTECQQHLYQATHSNVQPIVICSFAGSLPPLDYDFVHEIRYQDNRHTYRTPFQCLDRERES